ncbi:hypothetical protein CGJ05_22855, partial [Vibrio parahaemolyticus]
LQLGCSIENVHIVMSFNKSIHIYFSKYANDLRDVIKIHFPKNKGFYNSNVVILTEDGLELGINENGKMFARKIDMIKFSEYHKDISLLDLEYLILNEKLHILEKEISEFNYSS